MEKSRCPNREKTKEEVTMITKEQAVALQHGDLLCHISIKDSQGNPAQCRVNGACKTWKRSPEKFEVPVKHGLYTCFYITNTNAHEWERKP
jgi:hypothetical protein